MSMPLSRFVDISMMSKNPSVYSTSQTFNPTSNTSFLKNMDLSSHSFHGSTSRSMQYNMPERWKNFVVPNNITPPEPPLPSGSPSGSLRNWVLGLALTFILPFFTHKWGPFILLKDKVEKVMETTEHVMEAIEVVAKRTDEILDEITGDLPEDNKLRKTLEAIDEKVEGVTETAHLANQIIDNVEEMKEKLETLIVDEAKEQEAASKRVRQAQEEKLPTQETSG
ncbi:uncharacterized protein LOC112510197 [Cynara cardunculus var. scolymus]|uniref:Uncharacterized protein n=1 Tax=Cynara cardunculus var. scolymus TaxID=59895 RepID=A0A118K426_CYNCS|nr:uncharacterized protein LOC112510197 [Cynara cardunculus var. scolymus]KVI06828.1 hypothetical protein Ccrd_014816 [Cynara cardunculus var. scolymus]